MEGCPVATWLSMEDLKMDLMDGVSLEADRETQEVFITLYGPQDLLLNLMFQGTKITLKSII